MSLRVEVLDETGSDLPASALAALVEAVVTAEQRDGVVGVVLVDEAAMTGLNERYRGGSGSTDVLSFLEEGEGDDWPDPDRAGDGGRGTEACPTLGEIVVCPSVVAKYAGEEGVPLCRQMGWTVIHGILHLLGYDHEVDQGQMRAREQALLIRFAEEVAKLVPAHGRRPQIRRPSYGI
ncbi:MAG: rRNA maturation RNase YbeY [Thermoleophilia bacterium]|jgi:probable rRNA maturation factor